MQKLLNGTKQLYMFISLFYLIVFHKKNTITGNFILATQF